MKIAQIAPLFEAVPPRLYGGTERVVHYLTEALVEMGHDVTLFASGDSKTKARLIANVETATRLNPDCVDPLALHTVQIEEVMERAFEFDILHFHTDYLHFPFSKKLHVPCVTTLHGRLDLPELQFVYNKFLSQRVISISNSQRKPLPQANWIGTVHHGIPAHLHKFDRGNGYYMAFIGRISPEKGVDRAIEIALATGIKLKIAAKIDKADEAYYRTYIKPMLKSPLIEFIGEINEFQKSAFLGKAKVLLFPINWEEPFGLVMIEAMACGTPVIAFKNGSVPEVIDDGKTGYIVETVKEAVNAVSKCHELSRATVRRIFEKRFTATKMAESYLKLYALIAQADQKERDASLKRFNQQAHFLKNEIKKVV